jgi:hypothetical protein
MGVGSQAGDPCHPPPPPKMRNCPQNWRILAESPVPTTWQRSLKMPTGRKKAPTGRQVDAKGVTWPVGCGVRGRHFPAYTLINGYIKKPFSQIRGGKPSSTLLQWQSLPTSFPRAVRSEYPAYIVTRLYISWGEGDIRPQSRSLHSTDNISAEDSEQQEQSRPQQHMGNSKLFVVFPLKSTAAHSLHIQHLNVDWG